MTHALPNVFRGFSGSWPGLVVARFGTSILVLAALAWGAPAHGADAAPADPRTQPAAVWPPAFWFDPLEGAPTATVGSEAMVATAHPLATQAARDVLAIGGTAVDAAVAAQMMLGLVEPQSSGIGGGCFILVMPPGATQPFTIDGRECAPMGVDSTLR